IIIIAYTYYYSITSLLLLLLSKFLKTVCFLIIGCVCVCVCVCVFDHWMFLKTILTERDVVVCVCVCVCVCVSVMGGFCTEGYWPSFSGYPLALACSQGPVTHTQTSPTNTHNH